MSKAAIITDTDCSIPMELTCSYGIRQIPINVHFGSDTYAAVDELSDQQLFERVEKEGRLPTTSAPSPGIFLKAYEEAFKDGADEIVCFTVSSKISAVYNAAMSAKDLLPDRLIRVVDTQSLSMGQGFMVLAAAEAAKNGALGEDITKIATQTGERVRLFAALATLKYLAMSGRVGHLTAGIANFLDVRPILTLTDGKLDLLERARTQKKSWNRIFELTKESIGNCKIEKLAILHVNAIELANQFHEQFCEAVSCPEGVITAELTPGLSVHSGTGVVGACFLVGS